MKTFVKNPFILVTWILWLACQAQGEPVTLLYLVQTANQGGAGQLTEFNTTQRTISIPPFSVPSGLSNFKLSLIWNSDLKNGPNGVINTSANAQAASFTGYTKYTFSGPSSHEFTDYIWYNPDPVHFEPLQTLFTYDGIDTTFAQYSLTPSEIAEWSKGYSNAVIFSDFVFSASNRAILLDPNFVLSPIDWMGSPAFRLIITAETTEIFRIVSLEKLQSNRYKITWTSLSGQSYLIETSTDLAGWSRAAAPIVATDKQTFTIVTTDSSSRRFWRVKRL